MENISHLNKEYLNKLIYQSNQIVEEIKQKELQQKHIQRKISALQAFLEIEEEDFSLGIPSENNSLPSSSNHSTSSIVEEEEQQEQSHEAEDEEDEEDVPIEQDLKVPIQQSKPNNSSERSSSYINYFFDGVKEEEKREAKNYFRKIITNN
ncbi:hypothetical protein LCL95_07765 [Bacillus timonensis]|nr:hypothetical protein [Bacillus timonensis]